MWTSQAAMELQVPIPTSDLTVAMRDMSAFANGRAQAEALLRRDRRRLSEGRDTFLARLSHAFYAAMIITDAQGMALLSVAPEKYNYHLDLEAVARIWRGGCIIRAALLEAIRVAFRSRRDLPNLLLDPLWQARLPDIRKICVESSARRRNQGCRFRA